MQHPRTPGVAAAGILTVYPEVSMITRVRKWGNSLGIRIPRALAAAARVQEGGEVELAVRAGRLTVRRVGPRAERIDLGTLLRGVTRKNLHREVDFGAPMGRELL